MTEKRIRVRLDAGNTKAEIKSINSEMTGLGSSADKTTDSMRKLTSIAQAVASALAAAQIVKYADSWITVNNRLNQATSSASEFVAAQKGVIAIAQASATDLEGVASAYSRLAQATSELNLTQEQLLNVTNKLTLALKAGGATADETSSVMIQLAQGLGSGALQGDELRSILEASIPISKALAKEFGVNVGQLKTLGSQGLITADKVISAIENMDSSALSFTKTFADGLTSVNNSLTVYVGEINESLGATKLAGEALNSLADNIETVGQGLIVVATVFGARLTGAIASSTNAYIANIAAAKASDSASTALLAKNVALAESELAKNIQIQAGAKRYLANAKGAYALGAATTALARANGVAAASQANLTAAMTAYSVAATRATLLTRGASAAMALLGGPLGVAIIAAAAILYFAETAETAQERTKRLSDEVQGLTKSYTELNEKQRQIELTNINNEFKALQAELQNAQEKLNKFKNFGESPIKTENVRKYTGEIERINVELDKLSVKQQAVFNAGFEGVEFTEPKEAASSTSSTAGAVGTDTSNEDAFNKFVSSEQLKTQFLRDEIALRQQLELDNATQEEESFQLDILGIAQQYELRTQAILENERLSNEQKNILTQELFEQEAEAQRLRQQQLTTITEEGESKRTEIELLAQNARISNLQSGASSALSLLGAFGNQSFKTQKKFAIAESIVNIAGGVAKALNNPYPANLAFAAQVAAQGAGLISTIKSSQPSSGGSVSVAGASATTSTNSTISSSTSPASTTSQTRVIDIRGIENGQSVTLTKEELLSLLQDDEDVQIAVNNGQTQASRVGAI